MNVLITGDRGYIGSSLTQRLKHKFNITSINRDTLDLTNAKSVRNFFIDKHFDVVIHTAIEGGHRLVRDDKSITHNNLTMFYNILENKMHYNRLINFSSGGEIFTDTPYGLSKNIITRLINNIDGFFNLKLYGVFDEYELNSRFIKSNLLRYINRTPMIIYKDKLMDFFYMNDLTNVVEYYITSDELTLFKNIDCVYKDKYTLSDLAKNINSINNYKVEIVIEHNDIDEPYIGNATNILTLPLKKDGILRGINNTYKNLI